MINRQHGILLIGCGHIGKEHIEDIYYRDNIRIAAVADKDPERAASFARRYGALRHGTDYRAFLKDPLLDIVIIASYADSHLSILKDCLKAGLHVLCEKPIAADSRDGRAFYDLVRSSRSKVLVAHILRHNKTYQTVARMIREGAIGELKLMRMVQNHHALDWPRYKRLMEDCPPFVDCGVHYLDVMQWFSGSRITQAGGFSTRLDADSPCDNHGVINVRLENGCMGYYEAGWSPSLSSQNVKEFVGSKGHISLTLQALRHDHQEEGDLISLYSSVTGEYRTINVSAKYKDMYAQLQTLIRMIEEDADPIPSLQEAYSAFCAALTAKEAIAGGTVLACPGPQELFGSAF